jgi:acetolactate synthase-1/3 small subunit
MTIVVPGDYNTIMQVVRQLGKLEDTRKITVLDQEDAINSELLLIKVSAVNSERASILKTAQVYGAKVLNTGEKSVTLELTGNSKDIDDFIHHIERNGILELARTGMTALSAGDTTIND